VRPFIRFRSQNRPILIYFFLLNFSLHASRIQRSKNNKMRFALALLIVNALFGRNEARKRIVGGDVVSYGEFPYYIWTSGSKLCGGSIIWGDFLLTAAHCAQAFNTSKSVRNNNITRFSGVVLSIDRLISHPQFDIDTMANDIMLVKLKQYSSKLGYVTLNADPSIPNEGASVTGMGYGSDGIVDTSKILMKVNMPSVGYSTCADTYGDVLDDNQMTCTGGSPDGGKDTCVGDSGGPMMLTGTKIQIGIVSWGAGCAEQGTPSINTRVSTYIPWIKEQVCMHSAVSPPWNCPPKIPITAPTSKTTMVPVHKATMAPVRSPTNIPQNPPTRAPFHYPTIVPIYSPTAAPVNLPSMFPIHQPSNVPVSKPSKTPARKPTKNPIRKPTKNPVTKTTRTPVTEVSKQPSKVLLTAKMNTVKVPLAVVAPVHKLTSNIEISSLFTLSGTATAHNMATVQQCRTIGSQCISDSQCCGVAPNRCTFVPGQQSKQCMITL
jgi:trypsin